MLKTLKNIRRRDTDKYMIPHSVQEVIPIRTVWKSGILLVGQNRYSRTWQFSDINYALAGEEDQKSMLLGYSALLNLCDSNADTKLSIVTRKLNRRDFEEYIMIPYENDGRDHYRKEYNDMLLEKASYASGMIRDLYITVTITRKSYKEAESYFTRTGSEYIAGALPPRLALHGAGYDGSAAHSARLFPSRRGSGLSFRPKAVHEAGSQL